ncbi:MAG: transcription termination factor Rho [Candidatus Levyibacteriota bacterium]
MPYKKKTLTADDIVGTEPKTSSLASGSDKLGTEPEKREESVAVEEKKEETPIEEAAPFQETPVQEAPASLAPREQYPYQREAPTTAVSGILDIQPEGHGFLRPKFTPSQRDVYISQSQIRRFMLRPGDLVEGVGRPPKDTERYLGLLKVEKVNGMEAETSLNRPYFDDLTPIYPKKQIVLATGKTPISTRIIDLFAPIGFGQRGMVVSPPKAGKTTILKEIAAAVAQNFPKAHLIAALIGERPEEVTDIGQSVKGDVVSSNFDEPPENQTRIAEIALDRAKRLVEQGIDVVILLDSITRLARAYNLAVAPSGRTLSGGFDPAALWPAKKFFGAARSAQEGGSLTIIGTALVETGSRMDDLIYEEFKGTGNMELHLDRKLADKRVFPSINIERSGTRQEELLIAEEELKKIVTVRRMLDMLNPEERTSILIERLSKTETNEEFFKSLQKA